MNTSDPVIGDRRPAEKDADELFNESQLNADLSQDLVDIDKFMSQKPNSSRKKAKQVLHLMTQRSNKESVNSSVIADSKVSGVIKRVTLKNFMCHSNFKLDFGPRLNFIIGHNGSGKSSVLTAISICLGAKATETNRGSSLRDLIKEGTDVSEVTVVLANEGEEAYEPGKFGKEIIIQRVLRRDATSFPYSIKSENGKKVSSKKGDLDNILDYFNIAVNNPMCFLSQDMARSFLTASSDEQKYKFFMRGTLMEEILENLKKTRETISNMEMRILQFKEAAAELKIEASEARKLHDRLNDSKDLRHRQRLLHGKYLWLDHRESLGVVDDIHKDLAYKDEVISKLDYEIEQISTVIEEANMKRNHYVQKKASLDEVMDELKAEHTEKKSTYKEAVRKAEKLAGKVEDFDREIANYDTRLQELSIEIRREEEEIRRKSGGDKDLLDQQYKALHEEQTVLNAEIAKLKQQGVRIDEHYKPEFDSLSGQIDEKRESIRGLQEAIQRAKNDMARAPDPLNAFPTSVRSVVKEMQRTRFRDTALGPIGAHIFLKPGFERYQPLVESQLGGSLATFIVHNTSDQATLTNIMRKNNFKEGRIIIRRPEKFNFNSGKPDANLTTMLDILDFDDEEFMYALIDANHIESVVLVDERTIGQSLLESRTRSVQSVLALSNSISGLSMRLNHRGGLMQNPVWYDTTSIPKLKLRGGVVDTSYQEEQVRILSREKEQLEYQKQQLASQNKHEKQTLFTELKTKEGAKRRLVSETYELEKKLNEEADTGKLEALQEDYEETKRQTEVYRASLPEMQAAYVKADEIAAMMGNELAECRDRARGQNEIIQLCTASLMEAETEVQLQNTKKGLFAKKKDQHVQELEHLKTALPAWEAKAHESKEDALQLCTAEEAETIQIDNMDQLKTEIQKILRKVAEADETLGKSPEEIIEEDAIARAKFQHALSQFQQAKNARELLSCSFHERLLAFRGSRDLTWAAADLDFKDSLQFRNFSGNLEFDVTKSKLKMLVSTKNDKKPRHVDSLSGGEKSFSQIALLLATWKPMKSRIKGLDEFDVFMDQVNRKIGMRLMLSKLSREVKAQTIFITPQDIGQIADLDPSLVQIHRIKDPRAKQ